MAFNSGADPQLDRRLDAARREAFAPLDREAVTEIVTAVLGSMEGDISAGDLLVYRELEMLARYIQNAQREFASLRPDDIRAEHIPDATDQLDAVVKATEQATNTIMDACDAMNALATELGPEIQGRMLDEVTKVYEACNFQDITGQRITKVVRSLRHIEQRIEQLLVVLGAEIDPMVAAATAAAAAPAVAASAEGGAQGDAGLLHGPQLPGRAIDQDEIDRILASFD